MSIMQEVNAVISQTSEKFSQRRRVPKLPLIIIAIVAGAIGTYALISSFAATNGCDQTVSSVAAAQSAVSSAAGGSTICMSPGSYGSINLSGTHSSNVTFQPDPSQNPNGAGKVTFSGIDVTGTYITVKNFYSTRGIDFSRPAANSTADHNDVTNSPGGYGISISCNGGTQPGCSGITMTGNRIHDLAGGSGSSGSNCTTYGGDADGIRLDGWSNVTVSGNEIYHIEQPDLTPCVGHTDCFQSYQAGVNTNGPLIVTKNYSHDNQCQGPPFIKDGNVQNVTVTNNLSVRNNNRGLAGTALYIVGNTTGAIIKNNVYLGGSFLQSSGSSPTASANVDHNIFGEFNISGYSLPGEGYNIFTSGNQWSFSPSSTDLPQGPYGTKYNPTYRCGSSCGNGTPAGDDYRLVSNPNNIGIDWSPADQVYGPVDTSGGGTTPPPPPADTTAPTVSVTAPAGGSTVSGASVAVSASASDDTGVAGVQFKLDGNNLGAEDTSAPYSTTWNTTTATNGTHTLTAIARDAAGNTKTASNVTVTVNNTTGGGEEEGGGATASCTTTVSSAAAAQSALNAANTGQVVCLADGAYGKLTLNATKTAPGVTVRAQNPGDATIDSASLSGAYITLAQFNVSNGVTIQAGSRGMTVSHNYITGGYLGVDACSSSTTACYDTKVVGNKFQGPYGEDAIRANRYEDSSADADSEGLLVSQNEITGVSENGNHSDCFQAVWVGNNVTFDRNYEHDNRCQGFFIKDQNSLCSGGSGVCGTVTNVKVTNNLFTRNSEPCAPAASGCGQPTTIQLFGPEDGVTIDRNTLWGNGLTLTLRDPGWANVSVTNNVVSQKWSDTSAPFNATYSASNNLYCNSNTSGTWPNTGFTSNCNPAFPAPTKAGGDDFRLGGTQGVNWKPSDFTYGPEDGASTPPPPTPDTTNPTVSFSSPTNGATVSGIVTSTVAASDNVGVTKVEVSLDGSLKMTDTDSPYNYSFDSKTLTNGSHTLTAKAYDAAGNTASTTITVTVNNPDTTPPNPPTGLAATAPNATTVNLSWTAATDTGTNPTGVSKYNVLRNGSVIKQGVASTTYSDTTAVANTTYTYVVQAVDGANNVSNNSNTATITTPLPPVTPDTTAPTTPANLTATATSTRQVDLAWGASTDTGGSGLAGYNVYRGGTKLNSTPITTTTYGDGTVNPGTSYSYRVEAVDGAGNKSAQTAAVNITVPQAVRGDVTGPNGAPDGKINLSDVSFVIRNYGTNNTQADVSGPSGTPDGKVDIFDISYIIRNYRG